MLLIAIDRGALELVLFRAGDPELAGIGDGDALAGRGMDALPYLNPSVRPKAKLPSSSS